MKNLGLSIALALFLCACGGKEKKEDKGFEMNRAKKEKQAEAASVEVPVDLDNKGVGPVEEVNWPDEIDQELAATGEEKFNTLCTACHMPNQRMIGPAMAGVFERRSPEWVMNMILNPDGMLKEDPIAKALLKEYNNAIMLDQNLSRDEARAIAEYLRTL